MSTHAVAASAVATPGHCSSSEDAVADRNSTASADTGYIRQFNISPQDDNEIVVLVPYRNRVACTRCTQEFTKVGELQKHCKAMHQCEPLIRCAKCGREGRKFHPIVVHAGKCTGGRTSPSAELALPFACESCVRRFASSRALTQHVRHAHKDVYNSRKLNERSEATRRATLRWNARDSEQVLALVRQHSEPRQSSQLKRKVAELFPELNDDAVKYRIKVARREVARPVRRADPDPGTPAAVDRGAPAGPPPSLGPICAHSAPHGSETWETVLARTGEIMSKLMTWNPPPRTKSSGRRNAARGGRPPSSKSVKYGSMQRLWDVHPAKVAGLVLDEGTPCPQAPALRIASDHFKAIFEQENVCQHSFEREPHSSTCTTLLRQISPKEVYDAITSVKSTSAAGPDGLTPVALRKSRLTRGHIQLAQVFTMWMRHRRMPDSQMECRTILIPKPGADAVTLGKWRPITVGNLLGRVYANILRKRLEAVVMLNECQRGFRPVPGLQENVFLVNEVIRRGNAESATTAVVLLDFAKAFDTVGHMQILECLRRLGVCESLVAIVENIYSNAATRLFIEGRYSEQIRFRRGVKQGCPLSTVLFNIVLDPLLCALERSGDGITLRRTLTRLGGLAYADDLTVLARSYDGMCRQLQLVREYCDKTGLTVNVAKCYAFLLRHADDHSRPLVDTSVSWAYGEDVIPGVAPDGEFPYLGLKFSPVTGTTAVRPADLVEQWCERVKVAFLKPDQKVQILNEYALPRLTLQLVGGPTSQNLLERLDGTIRQAVREICHLPQSATNGLLYASRSDGGLRLTQLASQVPLLRVRLRKQLLKSKFNVVREVASTIRTTGSLFAPPNRSRAPADTSVTAGWRKSEFHRWTALTSQGRGVCHFGADRQGNSWILRPNGMKASTWITCLQVRSNTYPTRSVMNRAYPDRSMECRLCRYPTESLFHLLSVCSGTQKARILRHNRIVNLLARKCQEVGWKVHKEPPFTLDGRVLRPDLIAYDGDRAVVVDVTVRYETDDPDIFQTAYDAKVLKYRPLQQLIRDSRYGDSVTFHGLAIGCRGAWPEAVNAPALKDLKIKSWHFEAMLARRAFMMSVDILRCLGDDWNRGAING